MLGQQILIGEAQFSSKLTSFLPKKQQHSPRIGSEQENCDAHVLGGYILEQYASSQPLVSTPTICDAN